MPQYREIYNEIVSQDERYNRAENSPGFRAVVQASDRLSALSGKSLDVGCGVGFAVEYLSGPTFDLDVFGVDVSDHAIGRATERLSHLADDSQRLFVIENEKLPFDNDSFSLVTCFDVLEHLEERHIEELLSEMFRVLRPAATFFGSVSCRDTNIRDMNGESLHRTVKSVDWWIDRVKPDEAQFDGHRKQLALWKRMPRQPS